MIEAYRSLARATARLRFGPPVTHVYNPLDYAWEPFRRYLELWGSGPKEALFLGMNPGPWGMAQTGIPFGEVELVKGWMRIDGEVRQPGNPHPKRPVLGFSCARREASGKRLWGWARERFKTPENFFSRFFVVNYCPLAFFDEPGTNLTPDKLPLRERAALEKICDEALRGVVAAMRPGLVVGVGRFAAGRAESALTGLGVRIGAIPHPSPANPQANKGWAALAEKSLRSLGVSP